MCSLPLSGSSSLEFLKGDSVSSQWGSLVLAIIAKVALWIAGLALPLIIWVAFLYLSYWGIANDPIEKCQAPLTVLAQKGCLAANKSTVPASGNLSGKIEFDASAGTFSAEITPTAAATTATKDWLTPTSHVPAWLRFAASNVARQFHWSDKGSGYAHSLPVVILYTLVGLLLFAISWSLTPNANSLHRLYRDRLSKAFLFDPGRSADGNIARAEASLDQGRDFKPLDRMRLSELYAIANDEVATGDRPAARKLGAPYHLINTALNIQGSDFANRRGRNADFFVFSPLYVGSEATRYAKTPAVEQASSKASTSPPQWRSRGRRRRQTWVRTRSGR